MPSGKLFENFDKSIKYDPNKNRTQNFRLMPTEGNTVEFWLKKDAFDVTKTEKEVADQIAKEQLQNEVAIVSKDISRDPGFQFSNIKTIDIAEELNETEKNVVKDNTLAVVKDLVNVVEKSFYKDGKLTSDFSKINSSFKIKKYKKYSITS